MKAMIDIKYKHLSPCIGRFTGNVLIIKNNAIDVPLFKDGFLILILIMIQ